MYYEEKERKTGPGQGPSIACDQSALVDAMAEDCWCLSNALLE
jgi:hypothetical protein